jgi:hypothetical protein
MIGNHSARHDLSPLHNTVHVIRFFQYLSLIRCSYNAHAATTSFMIMLNGNAVEITCTTRKTAIAGAPNMATAGATQPAGANGSVITGHCRRTTLCAGGRSVTAGAPAQLRRQRPCSTGARAAAPAVGLPALARAVCVDRRALRCADNTIRKFNFGAFFPAYYNTYLHIYTSVYIYNAVHIYRAVRAI